MHSSNQIEEIKKESVTFSEEITNGTSSPHKVKGVKDKQARKKKRVDDMLTAATSVKDENIFMSAFEQLDFVEVPSGTYIDKIKFLIKSNGLEKDDPRITDITESLKQFEINEKDIAYDDFKDIMQPSFSLFRKLLENNFTFQNYDDYYEEAKTIFDEVKGMENEGFIPEYIPSLLDVDEDGFAVSICTVDGQMINLGDYNEKTWMHAMSGVISYLIALQQKGEDELKNFIWSEPSGAQFNALNLTSDGKPHNPLNCAGSLMSSALIFQGKSVAKKYESYAKIVEKMIGRRKVYFNNEMFLSEVDNAHANYSLLYMMEEYHALPENTSIKETLNFYTQTWAMNLRVKDIAVLAATLANGGICPLTEERCFQDSNAVKLCISQMLATGMNTNSGQWAFEIGLPTKSAVSGATIMVVPNTCGVCVWSPKMNKFYNSHKGEIFLRKLVEGFKYNTINHQYGAGQMKKALLKKVMIGKVEHIHLLYQAKKGDLKEIRRSLALGRSVNFRDYDRRTALHLAANHGHLNVVKYLVNHDAVINIQDRFGNTPYDEAKKNGHTEIAKFLEDSQK